MIDFACKRFDFEEIVKCSLGLSRADKKLFDQLVKKPGVAVSAAELSLKTKSDLSTVQRGLKKLKEKGLVARNQKNLANGGYLYTYRAADKHELKSVMRKMINNWSGRVLAEIENW